CPMWHGPPAAGRRTNISPTTVARIFNYVSPISAKLPEVLSIDEFKGNTDAGPPAAGRQIPMYSHRPKEPPGSKYIAR
ncbi:MAG: hypothetical protein Q8N36_00105, partial [bacterium]|nr:hypothetical protein [bacterium]